MKKPKPDFSCTPRELETQIAVFFADAERGRAPLTDAALCYAVGLSYPRYRYILSVADRLATRAETPDKLPRTRLISLHKRHSILFGKDVLVIE